ncbi:unnamed protein product [Symbiodinium pilosum]|uniref:Beta-lactamase-related domain-containing protein n=1 Tax=Symbiodinium pilosum TaxID=2952 RepID=A0A812RQC4_SYMPI|nr:unnamed protein product [Symbiodinium pilosum]
MWRLLVALAAARAAASTDPWVRVRQVLQIQPFIKDVALLVGDGNQRLFEMERGDITLDTPLWVASSSKMVFVVRAMQMIEKGVLQLHDPVNKYLPYWTQDSNDPRSQVTLYHLLSFQSGYTFGLTKVDSCWLKPWLNFSTCVERLYHSLPLHATPGTVWDYNEFHNQVVAAVLEKVTSTDIHTLLAEDLVSWNMTHSRYPDHFGPGGPDVSADLVTTAVDYEQFMMKYFGGQLLKNETVTIMEQDHMPARCSLQSLPLVIPQGHYGIGNWWLCSGDFDPLIHRTKLEPMPKRCVEAQVHSDQGLFGFWPVWDRRLGYWMLLAAQGLPLLSDMKAELLQTVLKPFIDKAVQEQRGAKLPELPLPDWGRLAAKAKVQTLPTMVV